MMTKWC